MSMAMVNGSKLQSLASQQQLMHTSLLTQLSQAHQLLAARLLQAVPGASDAIKLLQARRVPYKFVTNTTTNTRAGAKYNLFSTRSKQMHLIAATAVDCHARGNP